MNYFDVLSRRTSKRKRVYKHLNKLCLYNESPVTLEIFPSNNCNLNCSFCSYDDLRDNSELSVEVFDGLLDSIVHLGIDGVVFSGGGEPTTNMYLPNAIEKLYSHNVDVGLISNGMRYSKQMIEAMKMCLWIRFSLNAIDGDGYETLTGMPANIFENIKNNIKNISYCLGNTGVVLGISVLVSDKQTDTEYFFRAIELAHELGVNQLYFKPLLNKFQFESKLKTINNVNLTKINQYAQKYSIVTNINKFNSRDANVQDGEDKGKRCKIIEYNLVGLVTATGQVYPCLYQYTSHSDFCIGNINNMRLEEIYSLSNVQWVHTVENICKCNCDQCRYSNLLSEIEKYERTKEIELCTDLHANFL